jgi:hypothetical protein
MYSQCFYGILGTGGIIPAGFGEQGRDRPLVNFYRNNQEKHKKCPDPPDQKEVG